MGLADFQEQIEIEREWRESEIRFLDNNQRNMVSETDRSQIRRSIICLLYAHIEGFIYFSFSLYIDEINKKRLKCSDVKPAIAAAAFHDEFRTLKNEKKKSAIFRNSLPDDTHLHKLAREIEFVERIEEFHDHVVEIPEKFINTESNVGQSVVEKLLYKVGLNYEDLRTIYAPLNRLKNARNDISHGQRREGIADSDYHQFITCCNDIINAISVKLTTAYGHEEFLAD